MTQSRHSGTPLHLTCSPHPPTAQERFLPASPLPRLLGALQRGCSGWVSLGKEAFPTPRATGSCDLTRDRTVPEIQRGLGSVGSSPTLERALLPLLHPRTGTAKDGSQDAPQGSAPPSLEAT